MCHWPGLVTAHGSAAPLRGPQQGSNSAIGALFADCKWDGTDRWEIGEGQDCVDNIGILVAAIRHTERHAVTTIVGPDGEDMDIESGIKRRPPHNVCGVLSSIYANLRRYTYHSAAAGVRFRHERLAVTGVSHASAAGVPRMAPIQLYPRRRSSFASGRQCCSTSMKENRCDARIVLPCTGFAMFQVHCHASKPVCHAFLTAVCAGPPLLTSFRCSS